MNIDCMNVQVGRYVEASAILSPLFISRQVILLWRLKVGGVFMKDAIHLKEQYE